MTHRLLGSWSALCGVGPMIAIEVLLRTSDLPTICRRLGIGCTLTDTAAPATDPAVLPRRARQAVRGSVALVSRWPAGDSCLRRCLLTGHRLRDLRPVLRIGVARTTDGEFAAHSWLEIDGNTLDPQAVGFVALGAPGQ